MRRIVAVVVVLLVAASCGNDEASPESDVTTTTSRDALESTTTEPATPTSSASPSEASMWPWHAPDSAHADPVDAVMEFIEFLDFDPLVVLGEFQQGDARSGEIEVLPPFLREPFVPEEFPEGSPAAQYYEQLEGDLRGTWAGPTTAFVRLDDDDNWVVTGAASDAVVVEEPTADNTVSSPLDVLFTNTVMTDRVEFQLWPDRAVEPVATKAISVGGGVYSFGEHFDIVEWSSDASGPATAVVTSGDPVAAVLTIRLTLEPTPDRTFVDPIGDRRLEIEYQPDLRLSIHEPDDCGETPRPAIVGAGYAVAEYRDELTDLGYVLVQAQMRSGGATPTLDANLLRAVSYGANDLGIAVQWVRAHAGELCIDADRIAVTGVSINAGAALALAYTGDELEPGDTITIPELGGSIEVPDDPPPGPPAELAPYSTDISAVVAFLGFALPETIDPGEPPAMLINGRSDPAAPFALAERTCAAATAVGVTCELLAFDGGHESPPDAAATVAAIDEFLRRQLDVGGPVDP